MTVLRATVLSLLIISSLARSYPKRQLSDDEKDPPLLVERSDYIGRKVSSSIVVGNYLYIDGGEVMYKNGNVTEFTDAKSTESLDISSSWTNATAVIKQIEKAIDGRSLDSPKLWHTLDNSSFYEYNGDKSWFYTPADPPANKLYKFTSDGSGGGQWSEDDQSYTASSNFTMLARVGGSASACGPDTCYTAGGWRNSRTDNAISDAGMPASGLVHYNLTSGQWYNDTLVGSVFLGPWYDGHLFFTEIAGSKGALIAIGGEVSNLAGGNTIPLSFENAYIYDIANKSWYQQGLGGVVPALPRVGYCTVGLQGDNAVNKTYEIFMYGGSSSDGSSVPYDDVWVLSIPSFTWHQAGHTPVRGRSDHTCSVAGQRQMVIIGGLDPDGPTFSNTVADIWPLGLGVFDLSDMVFKDRYDADASVYTSPEAVKRWYAENGPLAKDINDDVKSLFQKSTATSSNPSSAPSPTDAQPSAAQPSAGGGNSGSVNKGAIAGGVVGGVVALAAVVACVWISMKRRRRRQSTMPNTSRAFESGGSAMFEADGRQTHEKATFEADGRQTYEKEALQRHELQ